MITIKHRLLGMGEHRNRLAVQVIHMLARGDGGAVYARATWWKESECNDKSLHD